MWSNVLAVVVLCSAPLTLRLIVPLLFGVSCLYLAALCLRRDRVMTGGALAALGVAAVTLAALGDGHGAGSLFSGAGVGAAVAIATYRRSAIAPVLRVVGYLSVAIVIAGRLPFALVVSAASLLVYLLAVEHVSSESDVQWPLLLLFVPLIPTVRLIADPVGAVVWLGLLAFLVRQLGVFLAGRREVEPFVAGIALLDAVSIAHARQPWLAIAAASAFVVARVVQRF